MNAIRAIHPYRHEGLFLAETSAQRRHPEARRAGKRLPGVLAHGPVRPQDWLIADDGGLALPGPMQPKHCR